METKAEKSRLWKQGINLHGPVLLKVLLKESKSKLKEPSRAKKYSRLGKAEGIEKLSKSENDCSFIKFIATTKDDPKNEANMDKSPIRKEMAEVISASEQSFHAHVEEIIQKETTEVVALEKGKIILSKNSGEEPVPPKTPEEQVRVPHNYPFLVDQKKLEFLHL